MPPHPFGGSGTGQRSIRTGLCECSVGRAFSHSCGVASMGEGRRENNFSASKGSNSPHLAVNAWQASVLPLLPGPPKSRHRTVQSGRRFPLSASWAESLRCSCEGLGATIMMNQLKHFRCLPIVQTDRPLPDGIKRAGDTTPGWAMQL